MSVSARVLDELPATRAAILRFLKKERYASISQIAAALTISHEAARKQVVDLQRSGWIGDDCPRDDPEQGAGAPGRPAARYCLTAEGDHFFPKQYPELTVELMDLISRSETDLTEILTRFTDERVDHLAPRVAHLPLHRGLDVLRAIYTDEDPFTDVQRRGDDFVLVERNCPYLDVALRRPAICSTTVSALRRLTGCEVVRERRFQDRDGRCEFHVRTSTASAERKEPRFEKEPPRSDGVASAS